MKNWIWLIFVMMGCSSVYVPNARNSPLLRKAGEVQGSVGFGNGLDVQGAVAVTNHIGLMANYSYEDRNSSQYSSNPSNDDYHYHNFFEGGLGYFENNGAWCYEIFAGYGRGEGASYDNYIWWGDQDVRATGSYDRIFIQPAFGMNKKLFHLSFVPRISIVDFKDFETNASTFVIDEHPKVFFEPAVLGRVNLINNRFFLGFQLGFSVPVASDVFYQYRPVQFSTGLGFRFGGIHGATEE
ncbi:MAG TPA: hypothetical protein VK658_05120 [Chryseolinea sp.]|nr:hypothetical protein [Chryseolinea sp.]